MQGILDSRSSKGSMPRPGSVLGLSEALLGGSWVVRSRIISRVTILITHIWGLITLLITTPGPPSTGSSTAL